MSSFLPHMENEMEYCVVAVEDTARHNTKFLLSLIHVNYGAFLKSNQNWQKTRAMGG